MKQPTKLMLMVVLFAFGSASLKAQNEKFKALFLYNFIKNIEWPAAYKQGNIVIGVFGSSSIVKNLETITASQKSGNQNMQVKTITSPEEVSNCHLIFISSSKDNSLASVVSRLSGSSTLIVTDTKNGISWGAAINFISDGDKLKFEISKKHIEQKGLKVSISLLNLGIPINE